MKTRCVQHSAHTHTQSWELLWKERKIERARNEREKRASSPVRLSEKQQPVVLVLHTHTHTQRNETQSEWRRATLWDWLKEMDVALCSHCGTWLPSRPTSLVGFDCSLFIRFSLFSRSPTMSSLVHTLSHTPIGNAQRSSHLIICGMRNDPPYLKELKNGKTLPTHSRLANFNESAFIGEQPSFLKKIT